MQFYTYEEFKKFLRVEKDLKFRTLFETLYFCGLRRGELRGLIWKPLTLKTKNYQLSKMLLMYLEILDIGILQHQKQNQVGELFQCLMC